MMFWEHHTDPLASGRVFAGRVFQQFLLGLALVLFAIGVGLAGYMWIGNLNWVDAFLESCMLLSGAGPLYTERESSNALKIFSSLYCLFGTLVVVVMVALLASPVVHRILHRVHFTHSKQ